MTERKYPLHNLAIELLESMLNMAENIKYDVAKIPDTTDSIIIEISEKYDYPEDVVSDMAVACSEYMIKLAVLILKEDIRKELSHG